MVVQHNLSAINTNRQMGVVTNALQKSTEKLSSGYKINRAADDAAGLSISEKMRNQIRGLNKASDNAQDGISLVQTAEGALNEVHSMLQRMSELSVQAANGTNATTDRAALNDEVKQLKTEIKRVASTTQFNKMDILKGDFSSTENKTLQVGANQAQTITIEISALTAVVDVAISDDLTIGTASAAQSSISHVQSAIEALSKTRSKLGALQNRLEHTVANLDNISENTQSAESRIRDTDMAEEMVQYSKNNILQQAGQSMLAQANQANQGGFAVIPSEGKIYAPADGEVTVVFDTLHAITMTTDQGAELLIHIGLDTVTLKGAPFTAHVAAGDHVKKGDLLLDADLEKIQEAGLHIITPVLVCNTDEYNKISILKEGEVSPGEDVLQIS